MTITLHEITDVAAYWVIFWTIVNALMPPREVFGNSSPKTQQRYNTILMIIAYYGALNVRQLTVKMYESVHQDSPVPAPHQLDNALTDAAANTQKAAEAIATAKDAVPGADTK